MMVGVSAMGLGKEWLGRVLDGGAVEELISLGIKYKFNAGLEGGEGETFVLDAPLFGQSIHILSGEVHWRGDSGYFEIADAVLASKATRKEGVAETRE